MSTAGAIRSETRASREGEMGIAPHIGIAVGKRLLQQRKGGFGLWADSGQGEGGFVPQNCKSHKSVINRLASRGTPSVAQMTPSASTALHLTQLKR